jgi:hypothetical protein
MVVEGMVTDNEGQPVSVVATQGALDPRPADSDRGIEPVAGGVTVC